MEVLEVKHRLTGGVEQFPCIAVEMTASRAVLLYVLTRARRFGGIDLTPGMVTVAYYWVGRPYNVYHWLSPRGETVAWYFNVSGPVRIADRRVEWQDLEVDVLVTPDLRTQVLDEDRLPLDLSAEQRAAIAAARDRVLREAPEVVRELEQTSRDLLARAAEAP
jgi:predicted RNA-binding protein associated with RNAse of E/G family